MATTEPSGIGLNATRTAVTLYDRGRDVYYTKPLLRGWLHLIWFVASLALGSVVLAGTHGAVRVTAAAIYTATVSGLFGVSALYHRGRWGEVWSRRLQRLDHTMIFLVIAGTATPTFLVTAHGGYGITLLIVMWSLTVVATAIHLAWMHAPERLVGATYIGLGCLAGLGLPAVWSHAGVAAGVLLLVGGVLYIVGAVSYHRRRPDPVPSVFGYHEVFHAYVCAAATCQYVAIAIFVL